VILNWTRQSSVGYSSGGDAIVAWPVPPSNPPRLVLTRPQAVCQSTSLVHAQPASSSDSTVRFAVDVRRLPWMRRLAVDYAFDFARVAPFFAGDPADAASWPAAIAAAQGHARPRREVTDIVMAQQERRGAPREALAAARRLSEAGTVAIVTGQQAGLFGGPAFTLLKAATAIRLAQRVSREHNVTAVPVFWIDAEDHDWEEVRTCAVLDAELELASIEAVPPDGAGERTIGSLRWPEGITGAIDLLLGVLPRTEFTPWLAEIVRTAYAPGHGVAESFGRLLDTVLGPHGLVVYDASDPTAKPLLAELFARELEHPGQTALLAARAGADLVSRGYHMQVMPHASSAALFELDGGRVPIRHDGSHFVTRDVRVPNADMVSRARTHPETFSPNVLLRPVVQDTLFPTICYVAGPNELAYLAQLRGVYESFGVPMPLMQPRASATLIDAAAVRFLSRHDVPLESLQQQDEHALNELLKTLLPPAVERSIREAGEQIAARMEAVVEAVPSIDPTLEGRARSALGRMQHELETLHAKVLQAAKRRDETLRRQFLHVRAQAFPGGQPQERAVGGVSFLGRYGPAVVARLLDELPVDGGTHWIVTI
jgi:bacillithiol synthase